MNEATEPTESPPLAFSREEVLTSSPPQNYTIVQTVAFTLHQHQYMLLKKNDSGAKHLAGTIGIGGLGAAYLALGKYLEALITDKPFQLSLAEGLFLAAPFLLAMILSMFAKLLPNDRSRLCSEIEATFKNHQAVQVKRHQG